MNNHLWDSPAHLPCVVGAWLCQGKFDISFPAPSCQGSCQDILNPTDFQNLCKGNVLPQKGDFSFHHSWSCHVGDYSQTRSESTVSVLFFIFFFLFFFFCWGGEGVEPIREPR